MILIHRQGRASLAGSHLRMQLVEATGTTQVVVHLLYEQKGPELKSMASMCNKGLGSTVRVYNLSSRETEPWGSLAANVPTQYSVFSETLSQKMEK